MTVPYRRLLLFTVFLTGAGVLIMEVAAVRQLTPYFGSSLSVLSSVLTIVLAALSIGYYWGGRLADRYPHLVILGSILAAAGLSILVLTAVASYLLPALAPESNLTYGPLFFAFVLFFLPAFLLGIDSPFVIKLLTSQTTDTGATVGTVFFWSTVGSIVGSLSAGFILIPTIGLTTTLLLVGSVVSLWAAVLLWYGAKTWTGDRSWVRFIAVAVLLLTTVLIVIALRSDADRRASVIYETDGQYSRLTVFERTIDGTVYRFLKNDTNFSSAIVAGSTTVAFPYASFALLYETMVPEAKNYLVLGGGAYTIPRHLAIKNPDLYVTTVEIEPYLLPLSQEYFEYTPPPTHRMVEADARVYIQSTSTTYDVIFSDVMNSGHFIPPHLMTTEFLTALKARLAPEGLLIFNYIGSTATEGTTLTGSFINTLQKTFPNYRLLATNDPDTRRLQNILIFARHDGQPITFPDDWRLTNHMFGYNYLINDHFFNIAPSALTDEVLFTDDNAPIERLISQQARRHAIAP